MLAQSRQVIRKACSSIRADTARSLHSTPHRLAVTKFTMPAMSPTMTEGGIASWKKKEGDSFAAGDVLLEIETDKATIDVEAQDDGVLGKIIAKDGEKNLPVGKVIALLVDEGDDISNLEVPKEEESKPAESSKSSDPQEKKAESSSSPAKSSQEAPKRKTAHIHVNGPAFPSVIRLLNEAGIEDYKKIKGTGVRGMLTKGDVLAYIGKASSPTGTYKKGPTPAAAAAPAPAKKEVKPVDSLTLRQMIVSGLSELSSSKSTPPKGLTPTFDDVIGDYLPTPTKIPTLPVLPSSAPPRSSKPDFLDGLI